MLYLLEPFLIFPWRREIKILSLSFLIIHDFPIQKKKEKAKEKQGKKRFHQIVVNKKMSRGKAFTKFWSKKNK